MSKKKESLAFTSKNNRLANKLLNEVYITPAGQKPEQLLDEWKYVALWDTGATNSMVTPAVAARSNLTPVGMTQVHTAGGSLDETPIYVIDLYLPNHVTMTNLVVSQGHFKGADVLIGMDVINHGDFSVSNFDGVTTFSFRIPSVQEIDFVNSRVTTKRKKPRPKR